jgi:hypothetical protein
MAQQPDNNSRVMVAKLASSSSSNRVTELSPVPLNRVMVVLRPQLAQELDRVTALKEALPSSNKVMVALRLEVLAEPHHMAVHPAARNQPTPTTETATATLSLLHPLHPTNRRLKSSFIFFHV